jgi:hypothetical protein
MELRRIYRTITKLELKLLKNSKNSKHIFEQELDAVFFTYSIDFDKGLIKF